MFDTGYRYTQVTIARYPNLQPEEKHVFSFVTEKPRKYEVWVERYRNHVYVIKFHLYRHSKHKNRYSYLSHDGHPSKVFKTVLEIGLKILEKDPIASFGFIGAHKIDKGQAESKEKTCRFRIYRILSQSVFDDSTFEHIEDEKTSAYLLVNRSHPDAATIGQDSVKLFTQLYDDFGDLA